jgi:hypothetical protein
VEREGAEEKGGRLAAGSTLVSLFNRRSTHLNQNHLRFDTILQYRKLRIAGLKYNELSKLDGHAIRFKIKFKDFLSGHFE